MLNTFLRSHFDSEIKIFLNDTLIYKGTGRNCYSKTRSTGVFSELFRFGNLEDHFRLDPNTENVAYVTVPELVYISHYLYGGKSIFGGRAMPYEYEIRKCENAHSCSLYKKGLCASTERLNCHCPKVIISTRSAGYRSKKGSELYSEYSAAKSQNVIKPFDGHFWEVGDEYCFYLTTSVGMMKHKTTGEIVPSEAIPYNAEQDYDRLGTEFSIKKDKATPEFFNRIFSAKPPTFFGGMFGNGNVSNYTKKIVPRLKIDIMKTDPELAKKLGIVDVDYVGKMAFIKTLKPGITVWDKDHKYHLYWDGETIEVLNSEKLCLLSWLGKYDSGTIKMIPSDSLTVPIEDNSWVLPTTEFRNY